MTPPVLAVHPTSRAQRGMVLASLADPDQPLFVEQSALAVAVRLDPGRLRRAWQALIAEQDMLRTAFAWDLAEAPRQVVRGATDAHLTVIEDVDLRATRLASQLAELLAWQGEPFDLTSAPLARLAVVPADDRTILLWTHHHAILDGWSQMLLVSRLLELCDDSPPPAGSTPTFADYDAWLNRRRPATEPSPPRRSSLSPPAQATTVRHGTRTRTVTLPALTAELTRAARLAAAAALAFVPAAGGPVGLGLTVSGRHEDHPESLGVVGPCSTTITVPVTASLEETFGELADRLQRIAADGWLEHPPAPSVPDVVVAVANYPPPTTASVTHDVDLMAADGGRTTSPITVVATPKHDATTLRIVNDRRGVSDADADRFADALVDTLDRIDVTDEPPSSLSSAVHDAPADDLDRLIRCFSEALGRGVGPDDDFFALGGHSLAALRALELVRAATGADATLRDLLEARTPRRLHRRLRHHRVPAVPANHTNGPATDLGQPVQPAVDDGQPFELTAIQQAYWAGAQGFGSRGIPASTYGEVDVANLDVARLERCLNRLIARHPALRTIVTTDGRQRVLPSVDRYYVDIVHADDSETDRTMSAVREDVLAADHDPEQWPLFCVRAVRHRDHLTRLYLDFDLLIGDAASWKQLYRELSVLYIDEHADLPPLALAPRDYVAARAAARQKPRWSRDRDYWQHRLDELPGAPELPPGPSEQADGRFSRRRTVLATETTAGVGEAAAAAGITVSGLLLGLFAETLRHWSRLPSFLINVTSFDRSDAAGFDGVVGDFTSLTLVDARPQGRTGLDRLRALHARLWDDLDHRAYSGLDVLRDLARVRHHDGPHAPVVFTSTLDLPDSTVDGPALPFTYVHGLGRTPQVHLDYQVHRLDGQLVVNWDTLNGAIDDQILDAMFARHSDLLAAVAADRGLLRCRDLFDAAPNAVPTGEIGSGLLLHDSLMQQAIRHPEAPAVAQGARTVTYGELVNQARRITGLLSDRPDGPVAVTARPGVTRIASILAATLSGRPYVPIGEDWPAGRVADALRATQAAVTVTDDPDRPGLRPDVLLDVGGPLGDRGATVAGVAPRDLAYLICTSGSTGAPKVVAVEHRAARNTVLDVNRRLRVTAADRVLGVSSIAFDLSVYDIFGVLGAGGTLVLPAADGPDPHEWHAAIARHQVTIWNSVPLLLELLLEQSGDLSSLRTCLLSGDWIPLQLPARLRSRAEDCRIVAMGGATEAAIWSIAHDVDIIDPGWSSIPYGRAMSGQTVEVLDAALRPRPVGVAGEICIGGVGLAREYVGAIDATARAFVRHPQTARRLYRTGDWGQLRADGEIELLGRFDDQVKIAGHRLELPEVERAIRAVPDVGTAAVVATEDRFARRLIAFVTGDRPAAEVRAALAGHLAPHAVPSEIRPIDRLPLTPTGKLDRHALRSLASTPPLGPGHQAELPRTDTAVAVPDYVRQILGPTIDLDCDLLSAGATSIELIRILAEHRASTGRRVDIADFYARPTLRNLLDAPFQPAETLLSAPRSPATPIAATIDSSWPTAATADRLLDDLRPVGIGRRSPTAFLSALVDRSALAATLAALRPIDASHPRRLHPSAGGRYAVQAAVHIRHSRVDDLDAGLYEYLPEHGDLRMRIEAIDLDASVHLGSRNDHLAAQAAFTVFLVYDVRRLADPYGPDARDLALLEAGYVGQVLCQAATENGLGLVPVHGLAVDRLRWLLGAHRDVPHALLGGMPA